MLVAVFVPYTYSIYFYQPKQRLNEAALSGKQVFQNYNCIACHQIYGLGGYIGPDITNVYKKKGPDYIRFVLTNGLNKMPKLNVSETEIIQLSEYLKFVDSTGTSPYINAKINWNGTVEEQ